MNDFEKCVNLINGLFGFEKSEIIINNYTYGLFDFKFIDFEVKDVCYECWYNFSKGKHELKIIENY